MHPSKGKQGLLLKSSKDFEGQERFNGRDRKINRQIKMMKSRSKLFTVVLTSLALLLAGIPPAQARQTNEVNRTEKKKVFIFEGGNPIDFIVALDRHFRTRLMQILTLPDLLRRTEVPKLQVAADDPREVLSLYNRLQSPTLGQWRFEPDATATNVPVTNMNVLMLVPDKSVVAGKIERAVTRVKALPLAGVPDSKWDSLIRDINDARAYGEETAKTAGDAFGGSFRIQRDSKVLIVFGSEAYIDMVESLVTAHRMNAEVENRGASSGKAAREGVEELKR